MGKTLLLGLLAPMLAGCALAAKTEARTDYQQSEAQYKACLVANPATPQNCEGLRLAMEADERKFNNMGASINGAQISHSGTIMSR